MGNWMVKTLTLDAFLFWACIKVYQLYGVRIMYRTVLDHHHCSISRNPAQTILGPRIPHSLACAQAGPHLSPNSRCISHLLHQRRINGNDWPEMESIRVSSLSGVGEWTLVKKLTLSVSAPVFQDTSRKVPNRQPKTRRDRSKTQLLLALPPKKLARARRFGGGAATDDGQDDAFFLPDRGV